MTGISLLREFLGEAARYPAPDLVAINVVKRVAFTDDGFTFPITNFYDACGEETEDLAEAVEFVAGPDADGKWWRDRICAYSSDKLVKH